jgi:N6-adenosine-specific RNA methylase IME4/ParB-like chromosome segregation protein Spo0J
MTALEFHPLANIFPLVEGAEFDELVADIRQHGLREPIVVYEDKILDGRNRYRACLAAGIEPTFTAYMGDDPISYVISLNLRRRHLDESQRALVAARLEQLKHGGNRKSDHQDANWHLDREDAASLLNVGVRSVARAAEVRDHGAPELVSAVERGEVSISAAADIATRPIGEQREIVARGKREILEAAKAIRAEEATRRRAARIERIIEISKGNSPLNLGRTYPVILADPPWKFHLYGPDTARVAERHYPTMSVEELCAVAVAAELATPDAVLFLWAPTPLLSDALNVMTAWGFEYVTNMVWVKEKTGVGHWVRNQHELLLIGRRGEFPTPEPANRPGSVIEAPRREHSQKPDEVYEIIEQMYPELPKIELFARQTRPGWAAWGNEVSSRRCATNYVAISET